MTPDELVALATARTLAGVPCAVAGFTNASTAHVVDFDDDGEVERAWSVPVDEPGSDNPVVTSEFPTDGNSAKPANFETHE